MRADGDFTVVPDADASWLAPDVGPPRTVGGGADHGALFGAGLVVGGVGCLAEFAMAFVLVGVGCELVEPMVGPNQCNEVVGGQEGDEAFLPVVMAAFDLAFGLGRWGLKQLDAVEVEGCAELGAGVGVVGVAEGVVVHIKGQGQAVGLEDAGKEVAVGQEGFARGEPCAGVEAGGVGEDFPQDLFIGTPGQPGVRGGVVLPAGPVIAGWPAVDGFGGGLVARVGGELVFAGPAAEAGAVGFEVEPTMGFTGRGAVGGRGLGGEEFGDQGGDFSSPVRLVIAARQSGRPGFSVAWRAGQQVVGAQLVAATKTDAQFEGGGFGREQAGACLGEELADQRRGNTVGEVEFFPARKLAGRWI